jgi:cell division control protein 6
MSDIIEDELFSSSVIKDMNVLDFDYVPEILINRDEQLRNLAHMFKPVLSSIAQNVVIKGPVGCGKTVIAKKFCTKLVKLTCWNR